jgi:hypothetical protein
MDLKEVVIIWTASILLKTEDGPVAGSCKHTIIKKNKK